MFLRNLRFFLFSCFLVLLLVSCSFLLSFLSPVVSSFSSVAISLGTVGKNPDDGRLGKFSKKVVNSSGKTSELKPFILALFYGIKKIEVIIGSQRKRRLVYPVDLLAMDITKLMLKQGKDLSNVNLDQLQGASRQQFLNLIAKNGDLKHRLASGQSQVNVNVQSQLNSGIQKAFFNFFKPYLLKIRVLEINEVSHFLIPKHILSFSNLNKIPIAKFKTLTYESLKANLVSPTSDKLLSDFWNDEFLKLVLFGFEIKNAFTFSINKIWISRLLKIQIASGLGITSFSFTSDSKLVDALSLVNSKTWKVSDFNSEDLQILKKLQEENIQQIVKDWIGPKLGLYKLKILDSLVALANIKIKKIQINQKTYQVDLLLKNDNFKKNVLKLENKVWTQLLALAKDKISKEQLDTFWQNQSLASQVGARFFSKDLKTNTLNLFFTTLKTTLEKFARIKVNQVQINQTIYQIGDLITHLDTDGSKLTGKAKNQLAILYNYNSDAQTVKDELDAFLVSKRNAFWQSIKENVRNLFRVGIYYFEAKTKNYSLLKLGSPSDDVDDKEYNKLSSEEKKELILLHERGITSTTLFQLYEEKINPFLESIRDSLKELGVFNVTEVAVENDNVYSIGNLISSVDTAGSFQLGDAKKELLVLHKHDGIAKQFNSFFPPEEQIPLVMEMLTTKLNDIKKSRNDFKNTIYNILTKLKAINVTNAEIVIERVKQNYSWLELTKPENIEKKYTNMSLSAQAELELLYDNDINDLKLAPIYENKIDSFLNAIRSVLQEFKDIDQSKVKIAGVDSLFEIGNLIASVDILGSTQVGDAKTELLALYNHDTTANVKTKLETALRKVRNDFGTNIRDVLVNLKVIKVEKIVIGEEANKKSYSIMELTKPANIGKKYDLLPTAAQTEFTNLLTDKVGVAKITIFYKGLLDSFLTDIELILGEFVAVKIIEVTIDRTTYPIADLTAVFNTKGSEQTGNAKIQLINLYNYNPNSGMVKQKLEFFLASIKNHFKISIQTALNDLVTIKIQTVNIDGNNYSVGKLLKSENIDKEYNAMSSDAQTELKKLWIGEISKQKLTSVYKNKTDSFLNAIRSVLQEFKDIEQSKVKITAVDSLFEIGNLIASVDKLGSEQVGDARTELLALYNHDTTVNVKTKLETALKKVRDDFETDIHDVLVNLKAIKVERIVIGEGVNEKSYSIIELIKSANIGKKYDSLPTVAQTEFTNLLADKVDVVKITTFYKGLLDSFLTDIKPTLEELAIFNVVAVAIPTINGKVDYPIGNLISSVNTLGSEQTGKSKEELVALYWYDVVASSSEFISPIEEILSDNLIPLKTVRNNFLDKIRDILGKLKVINVTNAEIGTEEKKQNYSWLELTKPTNIKKKYTDMPLNAQAELRLLYDNAINNLELTLIYENKVNPFLNAISSVLQEFKDIDQSKVKIAGVDSLFEIGNLIASVDTLGSAQVDDAKTQLLALYNHDTTANVKTKLETALRKVRNDFEADIHDVLSDLAAIKITNVDIGAEGAKQHYSLVELTKSANIGKQYDLLSSEAKGEFTKLLADKINKVKLTPIYENKINPFLVVIKPILEEFATVKIIEVTIDGTTYSIADLTAVLSTKGSEQTGNAKTQLISLYNSNSEMVKQKLEYFLASIKNNFKTNIQTALNDLVTIKIQTVNIDDNSYSVGELLKKDNINEAYAAMSSDAQTELTKLWIGEISKQKLTSVYKSKTNSFLNAIRSVLREFKDIDQSKVKIAGVDSLFEIGNLIASVDTLGLEQVGDAKTQLLALYNHDTTANVKTKLETSLKKVRDDFETDIHDVLSDLTAMSITNVDIGAEGAKQNYSLLELIKSKNIGKKYDLLSSEAKGEFTKLLADKINKEKLISIYENKINPFLVDIKSILEEFVAVKITEVEIDGSAYLISNLTANLAKSGSAQVGDAKTELLALYSYGTTANVKTKLETALKKVRDDFETDIHDVLVNLKAIKVERIVIGEGVSEKSYSIIELTKSANIGKKYDDLLATAQIEFTNLLADKVDVVKITTFYKGLLDSFLTDIKLTLGKFANIKIIEVTIDETTYPIADLTANLNTKGSEQTGNAKIQLISLYNYNSNSEIFKQKLESFLASIKNNFKISIQDALNDLVTIKIQTVNIDGNNYSVGELLKSENIDKEYNAMSSDAQTELTKLWIGEISKQKLTSVYKSKTNSFLNAISSVLQEFKDIDQSKVKITAVDSLFEIGNLIASVDKLGSEQVGDAKTELLVLYNHDTTVNVKTKLETALKKVRDDFETDIHDVLVNLKAIKVEKIVIGEGVNEKSYSIIELTKSANIGKKYDDLTTAAQTEFTKLFANGIGRQKLDQVFQDVKAETKNILAFQKNWNAGEVSSYLLWLPVFGIKKVKLTQNKVVPVAALATAIRTMLTAEKFDFTKLQGKVKKQLLNLLNNEGQIKEAETFQDDVWRQIKNHQKWKGVEGVGGELLLHKIRILLFKVQKLGISKVAHPFFPRGYDLSFLKDNSDWEKISFQFQELLEGMTVKINTPYIEFYSHLFPNKIVLQVPMKKLSTIFSEITIISIITALEGMINVQKELDTKKIIAFQKNWDAGEVSSYLLWLPLFDIVKVKLSQNKVVSVEELATAIWTMLTKEKLDFTNLQGEAHMQLLNLLDAQGKLSEEETFQDDVWKQIKNNQKWKTIEDPKGELSLQLIKLLLLKIQDLEITQVSHPFFPEGYDLSFLQDNEHWKEISFPELLQGMTVKINGNYVEFTSHLFPNQVVFQVPLKKLTTLFSEITIANIIKALEKAISDHLQQEKQLETKNQGLIIGLSVAGSFLILVVLGGFLYWFFKTKK